MAHLPEFCIPVENVAGHPQLMGQDVLFVICVKGTASNQRRSFTFWQCGTICYHSATCDRLHSITEYIQAKDRNIILIWNVMHHWWRTASCATVAFLQFWNVPISNHQKMPQWHKMVFISIDVLTVQ